MYDGCLIDFGLIFERFGPHVWMQIGFGRLKKKLEKIMKN